MEFSFDKVGDIAKTAKKNPVLFIVGGGVVILGVVLFFKNRGATQEEEQIATAYPEPDESSVAASQTAILSQTSQMIKESQEQTTQLIVETTTELYKALDTEIQNTNQTLVGYTNDTANAIKSLTDSINADRNYVNSKFNQVSSDISYVQQTSASNLANVQSTIQQTTSQVLAAVSENKTPTATQTAKNNYNEQIEAAKKIKGYQDLWHNTYDELNKDGKITDAERAKLVDIHTEADKISIEAGFGSNSNGSTRNIPEDIKKATGVK